MARHKARISEIFYSVNGEGGLVGLPALFIRFARCNRNCNWCDTPRESREGDGPQGVRDFSPESLKSHLLSVYTGWLPSPNVVFTGGEPLLEYEFIHDFLMLWNDPVKAHVETNGDFLTYERILRFDTVTISPKLGSAGPPFTRYEELASMIRKSRHDRFPPQVFLKFVAHDEKELDRVKTLILRYGLTKLGSPVYVQDVFCESGFRLEWLEHPVFRLPGVRMSFQVHKIIGIK